MTQVRVDNRKDILLVLLYSPGRSDQINEPISGRTRLVKMLFLFREEALPHFHAGTDITSENFYQFFPWDFGPFSTQVHDDLDFFVLHGFIEPRQSSEETLPESAAEWETWLTASRSDSAQDPVSEYEEQQFSLTTRGLAFVEPMFRSLTVKQRQLLREFKARTVAVPLRALLKYVYENYAAYTSKSTIRQDVLG